MRILLATDAWEPQFNGVVRTLTRTVAGVVTRGLMGALLGKPPRRRRY